MEIVINKLINQFTKGVSTYTHGDSTWLIFSESKQWVIELTGSKTLWYNYNFFQEIFHYASLDVVQNQHLITKWVEDNIINETKRTNGRGKVFNRRKKVESVIENGVKMTSSLQSREYTGDIDETLQKGVRITEYQIGDTFDGIEDIIEKGIKNTNGHYYTDPNQIDEIINNGIKETKISPTHTVDGDWLDGDEYLDNIIENGVKETNSWNESIIGDLNQYGCIDTVIIEGIEEIYEVDWKVPNYVIEEVISEGVKNSNPRQYVGEDIIDRIIDKGIIETHDDIYHHRGRVDGVIKNGIKETRREICEYKDTVEYIIQTGIKETEPMDDWVNTNRIVTEVIDNGIKIPTD